jgi:hypothetical protein
VLGGIPPLTASVTFHRAGSAPCPGFSIAVPREVRYIHRHRADGMHSASFEIADNAVRQHSESEIVWQDTCERASVLVYDCNGSRSTIADVASKNFSWMSKPE